MTLDLPPDLRARVEQARAEMDAERAAEAALLPATDELRQATLTRAHRILAARPCSRHELNERILRANAMTVELAAWAVERCVEHGLLDDDAYAASFIRARISRGHGARRIRADLAARGIDAACIDRAFAAIASDATRDAEADACERQLAKRYDAESLSDIAQRAKATRWLAGRGYDFAQIEAAIRAVRSSANPNE